MNIIKLWLHVKGKSLCVSRCKQNGEGANNGTLRYWQPLPSPAWAEGTVLCLCVCLCVCYHKIGI